MHHLARIGLIVAAAAALTPVLLPGPSGSSVGFDRDRTPRDVDVTEHEEYGPPPPGYYVIQGDRRPGWTTADMLFSPSDAPPPLEWCPLGPKPILDEFWSGDDEATGRVVDIAPHPTNPDVAYIASASGGVWITSDGGAAWSPLTDELPNLNHGTVAVAPSNPDIVIAGTGEFTTSSSGDGLFRSLDGGMTWDRIATFNEVGEDSSQLIIHPTNPDIIHHTGKAPKGHVFTTNGGATWSTSTIAGFTISDMAMRPDDPDTLWFACRNGPVYRTTDGGLLFESGFPGLPATLQQRGLFAIAPSDPDVMYFAHIDFNASLEGLYKSTNGGDSWFRLNNTPNFPFPQGWYDACITVDPADADVILCGGVFPTYAVAGVIRSVDGGDTWTDVTFGLDGNQVHPDQHTFAWGADGALWLGNDGGVWKTYDRGDSWINCNDHLALTQNYTVALHPVFAGIMMTGTQDNGTVENFKAGNDDWVQVIGGDGGYLMWDPDDPIRRYTTYVRLSVFRFVGGSSQNISGPWQNDSRAFIAPLVMDPNDPKTLLGGTNRVWRTNNADDEADWAPISTTSVGGSDYLTAIAVAPSDSETIYVGNRDGDVWMTRTDGAIWIQKLDHIGTVVDIVVDPDDWQHAYVAIFTGGAGRVWETTTAGNDWTDITGDLEDGFRSKALIADWRFDPPHLYLGTGAGVFSSRDNGTTWIKDGLDLPNVNIGDLAINRLDDTLVAATYGRGAWMADLPPDPNTPDLNGDGVVDAADLAALLAAWGPCAPGSCPGDLNGDGLVDGADLAILLAAWGMTP